jgi:hypothetical protein
MASRRRGRRSTDTFTGTDGWTTIVIAEATGPARLVEALYSPESYIACWLRRISFVFRGAVSRLRRFFFDLTHPPALWSGGACRVELLPDVFEEFAESAIRRTETPDGARGLGRGASRRTGGAAKCIRKDTMRALDLRFRQCTPTVLPAAKVSEVAHSFFQCSRPDVSTPWPPFRGALLSPGRSPFARCARTCRSRRCRSTAPAA